MSYLIAEVAMESMSIWSPPGTSWHMPQIAYNTQEQARRGEILTDIQTYRDTMIFQFVKGIEPLSNWDNYVDTMKRMGVEELTAMAQAAFDRYQLR